MDVEKIFEAYGGLMLRHAQLLLGRDALAEDAVQEALIRFMQYEPSFKDENHEKAWFLTVTGNICRDMLRKVSRRKETAMPEWFDAPAHEAAPDEQLTEKERNMNLTRAVMQLPVKYREPILLVYYHDLSGRQAAQVMGITFIALRTRLMRARDMLKMMLGEEAEL